MRSERTAAWASVQECHPRQGSDRLAFDAMLTGTVTLWRVTKGNGRVETDDGDEYWVHVSELPSGIKELEVGKRVEFEWSGHFMEHAQRIAMNVRPL